MIRSVFPTAVSCTREAAVRLFEAMRPSTWPKRWRRAYVETRTLFRVFGLLFFGGINLGLATQPGRIEE